ncbi:MAG: hypothetical protein ACRELZ_12065 [Candidatus Rokuibacteriota bacterium]
MTDEPTDEPVIDELTMRMAAALRKATEPDYFQLGFHTCVCGAISEAQDALLANGWTTNTLCVHYLAYHRLEVPEADLGMVRALPPEFEIPARQARAPIRGAPSFLPQSGVSDHR